MGWIKLSHQQIKDRVFGAWDKNMYYAEESVLGISASLLDNLY